MNNYTISIFDNKIFFEILSEIKLFSNFKILHYKDINLCINDAKSGNCVVVFFNNSLNEIKMSDFPSILITNPSKVKEKLLNEFQDQIKRPFKIIDFKKKIISLIAKTEFKKNSLIHLRDYIVDRNERKIKKNNLELQLSEKEVNFLILFSTTQQPISKNLFLKNVWNYSTESETHTVETHIHRLRKKIFKKFGDNNFIKNDNKGYYI